MFSAALECQCGHEAVLCVDLPPEVDVGQSLLLQWQAKLSLLGMALEMDHYLQGVPGDVSLVPRPVLRLAWERG